MKQGSTYVFDQADGSNWYHPLGMAYFPDGAHTGVDELEPGIAQTGGSTTCAAGNTCQAPMYFKNGVFTGTTYDNTAATPVGGDDFGLDVYEPEFFYPRTSGPRICTSSRSQSRTRPTPRICSTS